MKKYTIGSLSRDTRCNIETIRYYERIKLLGEPARTSGGQRNYSPADRARLNFILRSRQLGFSIADIRELLSWANGGVKCAHVNEVASRHLEDIRCKITDLERIAVFLEETTEKCAGGGSAECPVIDALMDWPGDTVR